MITRQKLILLPGLLCDERLWHHQIAALGEIADIVVADLTRQESMTALAREVLATAPDRIALAGLSMGGYVAQEIMRQAPERVTRLALLDTSARSDSAEQTERRRGLIQLAETGRFRGVTPRLLPLLIHRDRLSDKALTETVMAMAESVGQAAFLRQQRAIMGRPDGRPDLLKIRVPTLVLCGREDALTPPELHTELAASIPNARLVVIDHCGHLATMEEPEQVTAAMRRWLQPD
ncbi:MAG: alpha/beta fold hydrolase [Alphaproteobacteria bacterium]|nr:alpha/beta fold hydrolase [Alphaproteobacteria bacterium]